MIRTDVEAALVWLLEQNGIRWTTTERTSDLEAAAAGEDVAWIHGEDGSETYSVFCTDMIRVHYYGSTRESCRALAQRFSDLLTRGPVWTPHGLIDSVDSLERSTEPQRDTAFHEITERFAVETRGA